MIFVEEGDPAVNRRVYQGHRRIHRTGIAQVMAPEAEGGNTHIGLTKTAQRYCFTCHNVPFVELSRLLRRVIPVVLATHAERGRRQRRAVLGLTRNGQHLLSEAAEACVKGFSGICTVSTRNPRPIIPR